jgi:hypothetical protein
MRPFAVSPRRNSPWQQCNSSPLWETFNRFVLCGRFRRRPEGIRDKYIGLRSVAVGIGWARMRLRTVDHSWQRSTAALDRDRTFACSLAMRLIFGMSVILGSGNPCGVQGV